MVTPLRRMAGGLEDVGLFFVAAALFPLGILLVGLPIAFVGWVAVRIAAWW